MLAKKSTQDDADAAQQFCIDNGAIPFIPQNAAHNQYLKDFIAETTNLEFLWYPIGDIASEGAIKYWDGSGVKFC